MSVADLLKDVGEGVKTGALALLLVGCKPAAITPPLAPGVENWQIRYSTGMPSAPAMTSASTFYLDIPQAPNSVNYVTEATSTALAGETLTATFNVVATNAVYGLADTTTYGPAQIHLFLQRAGDNMTGVGEMQYYRWWCGTGAYVLPASGSATVTISCPLNPASWTSVYGQQSANEFQAALNNLQWAGFTFGGGNGWGHGVYMQSGSARFELQSMTVQ